MKAARNGSAETVVVRLPASRFESRDYVVRLRGISRNAEPEDVASYYFRVRLK